jgi:hypothetical protein
MNNPYICSGLTTITRGSAITIVIYYLLLYPAESVLTLEYLLSLLPDILSSGLIRIL